MASAFPVGSPSSRKQAAVPTQKRTDPHGYGQFFFTELVGKPRVLVLGSIQGAIWYHFIEPQPHGHSGFAASNLPSRSRSRPTAAAQLRQEHAVHDSVGPGERDAAAAGDPELEQGPAARVGGPGSMGRGKGEGGRGFWGKGKKGEGRGERLLKKVEVRGGRRGTF